MDDLISRRAAIEAVHKEFDECLVWDESGKYTADEVERVLTDLPSAQTEKMQLSTEKTQLSEEDATKDATFDCISRETAIDAVKQHMNNVSGGNDEYYIAHRHIIELLQIVPTAQPESRREWYMKGYRDAQAVSCTDLCVDCPLFDKEKHECPRFNRVIPRAIEEVTPRWIPVTPDSPPLYMPVLTWDGGTRHVEQRIPYIRDEYGEKIISDWWIDGDEKWDEWAEYQPNLRDGCAIKWMPLPEPYAERKEDE